MTLHRKHHRYTEAHARRQLARIEAQLATWRATDCTGNWRRQADKGRALASLEIQQGRWLHILAPPPIDTYRLPF